MKGSLAHQNHLLGKPMVSIAERCWVGVFEGVPSVRLLRCKVSCLLDLGGP